MAEREGERSSWVERVREAKTRLEISEKAEKEALARLPYTRAELEAALTEIGQKAKTKTRQTQR